MVALHSEATRCEEQAGIGRQLDAGVGHRLARPLEEGHRVGGGHDGEEEQPLWGRGAQAGGHRGQASAGPEPATRQFAEDRDARSAEQRPAGPSGTRFSLGDGGAPGGGKLEHEQVPARARRCAPPGRASSGPSQAKRCCRRSPASGPSTKGAPVTVARRRGTRAGRRAQRVTSDCRTAAPRRRGARRSPKRARSGSRPPARPPGRDARRAPAGQGPGRPPVIRRDAEGAEHAPSTATTRARRRVRSGSRGRKVRTRPTAQAAAQHERRRPRAPSRRGEAVASAQRRAPAAASAGSR